MRGASGPLLLLGAPMPAADFAPLAEALASDHAVVTTDPRGIANGSLDDPQQDSTPELRADDVAAILDDLDAESADVFGSSGDAVTGLALVSRHPTRVRTLIAHGTRFLAHELRGTARYRPDVAALTRGPARVPWAQRRSSLSRGQNFRCWLTLPTWSTNMVRLSNHHTPSSR